MTKLDARVRHLDEMAAGEMGLARAQALAAEADHLRRLRGGFLRGLSFGLPLLRN